MEEGQIKRLLCVIRKLARKQLEKIKSGKPMHRTTVQGTNQFQAPKLQQQQISVHQQQIDDTPDGDNATEAGTNENLTVGSGPNQSSVLKYSSS